jgi:cytochrome P450
MGGLSVDFDHHGADHRADPPASFRRLREVGPLVRSEAYGGYWIATGYDVVAEVAGNDARFSSCGRTLVLVPGPEEETSFGALPITADPPYATELRAILHPHFTPKVVMKWLPAIEHWTNVTIDEFIERGSLDIVEDLALPIPALFMSTLIGLPLDRWRHYAHLAHVFNGQIPNSPEKKAMDDQMTEMAMDVAGFLAERQAEPTDDLLSVLANAELDGERLDLPTSVSMAMLVIFGAFDTTTALLTHSLIHLAEHPEDRKRLEDDPDLIPGAVEEFLRFFTPTQALARTVTEPCELGGARLEPGDRILLSWASANRDPAKFDDPDRIVIDRFPNRHMTFGLGAHRCMGSNFARAEIALVLRIVLERMKDLGVDTGAIETYASLGTINGFMHVPATFRAGPKVLPGEHLPGTVPSA